MVRCSVSCCYWFVSMLGVVGVWYWGRLCLCGGVFLGVLLVCFLVGIVYCLGLLVRWWWCLGFVIVVGYDGIGLVYLYRRL